MEKFDTLAGLAAIAMKNQKKHFDYYELYDAIEKSYIPKKTTFLTSITQALSCNEDTGEVFLTGDDILQVIKSHEWTLARGFI